MNSNLIIYDVGSTYTKICSFKQTATTLKLLARAQVPTTKENIRLGLDSAEQTVEKDGILIDPDCTRLSTSSAAGGLRMVAMGYMPRVTAKAAKEVAMNAGARVIEVITHDDPADYRIEILQEIRPDIILLAGGTDGGDQASLLENAHLIVKADVSAIVIVAGNHSAQQSVQTILSNAGISFRRVANVMPTIHEFKVEQAREAIHEEFIRQIAVAEGFQSLIQRVSNKKVVPTPGAVLMAAELIAKGTLRQEGVGDLILVDIGGATTDVHSILPSMDELSIEERGLVVTNEKQVSYRTVEGNLGLRVSATGIVDTVAPESILEKIDQNDKDIETRLTDYVRFVESHPAHIAKSSDECAFDRALAITAVEVALKRHAGYLAQEYNPVMGTAPGTPIGRDLREVKTVIAVGGIFVYNSDAYRRKIMTEAFRHHGISLLPERPKLYFDVQYVLYAVGVLSQIDPDMALDFVKTYFHMEKNHEKNHPA